MYSIKENKGWQSLNILPYSITSKLTWKRIGEIADMNAMEAD